MEFIFFISFFIGIILAFFLPKNIKKFTTKTLTFYVTYMGLPILVYTALQHTTLHLNEWIFGLILTILVYSIGYVFFFGEKNKQVAPAAFWCATTPNIAYLGIPLAYVFFNKEGVLTATLFSVIIPLVHLTFGIFLAKKIQKNTAGGTLKTPLLWMMILAILASQFFPYSWFLFSWITTSTIYLIPLTLGLLFVFGSMHRMYLKAAGIKFILTPLLFMLAAFLFKQQILLYAFLGALPPALTNSILSERFHYDAKGSAVFTSYTTAAFLLLLGIGSFFA